MRCVLPVVICCSLAWLAACQTDQAEHVRPANKSTTEIKTTPVNGKKQERRSDVVYDDLEWLVGKWRCVSNQCQNVEHATRLSKQGPERVRWLNVYYPFSYGQMDLALRPIPQREIAAEFVVETPDGKRLPLDPGYPVHIGINKIVVGIPVPFAIEFTYEYTFDAEDGTERLTLRTGHVHLLFEKVTDDPGDVSDASRMLAPKDNKLLKLWKHDYQQLKFERMNCN